jgi:hypothetical protein
MDDRPGRFGDQVHHLGHRWGVVFPGEDDGARPDERRLPRLVEEGPDVARLILVVELGRYVDSDRRRRRCPYLDSGNRQPVDGPAVQR